MSMHIVDCNSIIKLLNVSSVMLYNKIEKAKKLLNYSLLTDRDTKCKSVEQYTIPTMNMVW